MDFYLAGMETTTTTLRWAMLYMAKYPEVQDKLRAEIAREVGFSRLPTMNDKLRMPYFTYVLSSPKIITVFLEPQSVRFSVWLTLLP